MLLLYCRLHMILLNDVFDIKLIVWENKRKVNTGGAYENGKEHIGGIYFKSVFFGL